MKWQTKKKKEKKNATFFKNFKAELKKVIWPTPKQVVNNTIAVIVVVLITAAIVFVLDLAFEGLNTYGINKLKGIVQTEDTSTENVVDTNTIENTDNTTTEGNTEVEENSNESTENVSESANESVQE